MRLLFCLLSVALLAGCAANARDASLKPYGVWQGTLPCADCSGIDTRLTLYKDPYLYRLEETYLGRQSEPVVYEGEWVLLPPVDNMDPGRVSLKSAAEEPLRQWQRLPRGNLEMLGRDGQPIRSDLSYTLQRRRVSE
ncbi:copper resistance protein NlpE [Marinobacter fonticola]|uniref:copper resistance protein NlpE n=1 Tax=Marinobacter fonticola TaxID=2603215 RepID=UPI00143D509B|nr:copper resistance protein NlpE [Marinobacter fonticola]